jgi:hypothetical protein
MTAEKAVFRGVGDVALVRWVISANSDTIQVTDDKGLADMQSAGITRRTLAVARRKAFRYDESIIDGEVQNWDKLRHF